MLKKQTLIVSLYGGNYTWFVSCADNSYTYNIGTSESRSLVVNSTGGAGSFILSCAGWCGFNEFTGGVCDNTYNACNDNCGLPYLPSHNCYAGDEVSEVYCLGGSQADACCCVA